MATNGSIVHPHMIYDYGGMIMTEKNQRNERKTCYSTTLFTTNPTWSDLGVNPGLCGEGLATNCLSHGTATGKPPAPGQQTYHTMKFQSVIEVQHTVIKICRMSQKYKLI
jgi:hypothetical protein